MASRRLRALLLLILPLALLLGGATRVFAQEKLDSLVIRGGGLVADFSSNLRLDANNGLGTDISFENDLGFTRWRTSWFVDGEWRIKGRHRLYGSFVDLKRDATKAGISQPITIGGTTFQIGANVQAFIDTSYLAFDYGLALLNKPDAEIVATIGISSVKVHTGVGLELQATTGASVSRSLTSNAQDTVIFPVPGVQFAFRPHKVVEFTGYTRFIKATLEGVTESSWDGRFGLELALAHHVGFGGAYYWNRVVEKGSRESFTGELHYRFNGPQFYARVHF